MVERQVLFPLFLNFFLKFPAVLPMTKGCEFKRAGQGLRFSCRAQPFSLRQFMLKPFQVIRHNPLVVLLFIAACFIFSPVLSNLRGRRLSRELCPTRPRARTSYQHRRLQNEQLDWETSRSTEGLTPV